MTVLFSFLSVVFLWERREEVYVGRRIVTDVAMVGWRWPFCCPAGRQALFVTAGCKPAGGGRTLLLNMYNVMCQRSRKRTF